MVAELAGDSEAARINMRTQQVLERYRHAVEKAYPPATAKFHLAHTNQVFIKDVNVVGRNGEPLPVRSLIVYVDDSGCSADLNAQRELIKLFLHEEFGEEVEDFVIKISGTSEYKNVHPYLTSDQQESNTPATSIPLDANEKSYVSNVSSKIEDKRLRKSLEKAMTADLEWKKGEKVEQTCKNTK